MANTNIKVNPIRRLVFTLAGLVAGDAVLLLFLLQMALRSRAALLAAHHGEPARQIPGALQIFLLYAAFSFVGWLFIGLPIALLIPARFLTRLSWPLKVLAGAALGPLALFAILVWLTHGHINSQTLARASLLWVYSVLVSIVSFVVYVILLDKGQGADHC